MLSEEFKVKTVLLPIEVPPDIYCWKFGDIRGESTICRYFDNEGGHNRCLLCLGDLKESSEGILKPEKCSKLKVVLRAVLDETVKRERDE